jgi:hypothetical protein
MKIEHSLQNVQNIIASNILPKNILAVDILNKNRSYMRTLIFHYDGGMPFDITHRHYGEYLCNLENNYILEFYKVAKISHKEYVWVGAELMTDNNGEIILFSKSSSDEYSNTTKLSK